MVNRQAERLAAIVELTELSDGLCEGAYLMFLARGLFGRELARAMRPVRKFCRHLAVMNAMAAAGKLDSQAELPVVLRRRAARLRAMENRVLDLIEANRAWPGRAELEALLRDLRATAANGKRRLAELEGIEAGGHGE